MTHSTISKYFKRARKVYRPANVKLGVSQASPVLEGQNKSTMRGFNTEQAEYLASTAEALILILAESFSAEWLGDNELTADYILNLAELLYAREVEMYGIYEYLATYDTLDDVLAYDINSGEDEFNLFFWY